MSFRSTNNAPYGIISAPPSVDGNANEHVTSFNNHFEDTFTPQPHQTTNGFTLAPNISANAVPTAPEAGSKSSQHDDDKGPQGPGNDQQEKENHAHTQDSKQTAEHC